MAFIGLRDLMISFLHCVYVLNATVSWSLQPVGTIKMPEHYGLQEGLATISNKDITEVKMMKSIYLMKSMHLYMERLIVLVGRNQN